MLLLHNFTTFGLHFLCVHPVLCPSSARSDQHSVGLCVVLQDGARDSHRDAQTFADLPTEKNYFVRHGECETQTLMLLGTTCLCLLCLCLCLCTFPEVSVSTMPKTKPKSSDDSKEPLRTPAPL